jgi:mono/diheme cytochrome c family protein
MPGFAHILTDKQIAELTAYLRTRFSGQPAWTDIERHVARIRSETGSTGGANSGSATRIAKGE